MTTTTTKGRISGLLALTCASDVALAKGDSVHVVGDYKVALADGTKPVIGHIGVRSVARVVTDTASTFPVATTTGSQVTVEARGLMVRTMLAGAAIAAGAGVGINSSAALVTDGTGVAHIGVALTHTTAAGQEIDVLVGGV
jgi:hypothetical protein